MDLISIINSLVNIIGIKMSEVLVDAYLGVFGVVLGFILSKYFFIRGKKKSICVKQK